MSDINERRNGGRWHERLITGQALATILIALLGQAVFSIIYQIINNEQQAAAINQNAANLIDFKLQVNDMRTPLSIHVFKLQDQFTALLQQHGDLNKRIDLMDVGGTRAIQVVTANQQRVLASLERLTERIGQIDGRLNVVENKGLFILQGQVDQINLQIKRIDEQQVRIIQALDNTYNTLTDFMREFTTRVPPPKSPGIQEDPSAHVPLPRPRRNTQ